MTFFAFFEFGYSQILKTKSPILPDILATPLVLFSQRIRKVSQKMAQTFSIATSANDFFIIDFQVVCGKCSNRQMPLEFDNFCQNHRVCDKCFRKIQDFVDESRTEQKVGPGNLQ